MEKPIIRAIGLTKHYGDVAAVSSLNLEIQRGEVFGLLGPNGAGKTTTTLMLLGLTEPTAGSAFIDGHCCTRDPISVKRIVGYLPDNIGFYPDMTGRENLRFTGRLNGLAPAECEERADRLLRRVGMDYAADRKAGGYSRGMRQRLGIADVLMKDPQVIVMDEPTLGIDPEGVRELIELIRDLSVRDGRTILISSHQLYQIQQICDRVGIFVKGRLIACGRIDELGRQLENEGVYILDLSAEPDDGRLAPLIAGIEGVRRSEYGSDGLIHVESDRDIRPALSALLAEGGFVLSSLNQRGGDLYEIYQRFFEKAGESDDIGVSEKKLFPSAPSSAAEKTHVSKSGLPALYFKELADHLNSRRFYLIFCLLLVASTASLIGALSSIDSSSGSSEFIFLKLFTTGSSSIYSFATFIAFLGPLAGITLGFDAVSNERALGTLNRLAAQPIYRDAIINAKFLAGATTIALITAALGLYVCGAGLMLLGIPPSGEEVMRIIAFLLLAVVYMSVWLALAIIFSVVCRHAATAALASISIWLFLSLFMGLAAAGIADMLFPLEGIEGFANMESNYDLELALNRISPYYLFSEAATTILNPSVRSIGIITMSSLSGAVLDSSLPFTQSLLLIWPHLVAMLAIAMAGFAIAYICFMRQEIRA